MQKFKKFKTEDGEVLKIYYDSHATSPREDYNLSKCIFFGKHKHIGDRHDISLPEYNSRQSFIDNGPDDVRKALGEDIAVILPVHMYIHSGTSISTEYTYPYTCRWDSGTVGFVVVTKKDLRERFGFKRISKKDIERATEIAIAEIKILNYWISGEVFGYVHKDANKEEVDSCWGFYGGDLKDNGILEHVNEKFRELIEQD